MDAYLSHYRIVSGPDLEQLILALRNSGELIRFTFAPHTATDPDDKTLFPGSTLISLGIADQDGVRRIELWNDFDDDHNIRFRGQYNPVTKTGTGSMELVPKPRPPAGPIEYLIGAQVHILGQTPTP